MSQPGGSHVGTHDPGRAASGRSAPPAYRLVHAAAAVYHGLLDNLLPRTCLVTGAWLPSAGPPVTEDTRQAIEAAQGEPYCPRCGRTARPETIQPKHCGGCRTEQFWNVAEVVRVGRYIDELREPLLKLKYEGESRCTTFVGELLADRLRARPWVAKLDALVPVPMHRLRRWQRPCNHAVELARVVTAHLGVPTRELVRRSRYNPSQVNTASRSERFRNVAGCFTIPRPARVAGRTICIIDNVLTSGATIHEVSKALRRAGAKRIYAAVVARSTLAGAPQPLLPQSAGTHTPPSDVTANNCR